MTKKNLISVYLITLIAAASIAKLNASDSELLTDFFIPENVNVSEINGTYFTFTGFRAGVPIVSGKTFGISKANVAAFPALTGLGVSYSLLHYLPGGINSLHTHPRGSELLYVITGSLEVGLIDTTNKLFTQTLSAGDLFVFPKGLVHYQFNPDAEVNATALSAFGSANPGLVSLPPTLFGSNIDDGVLEKSFCVSSDVITALKNSPTAHP